MSYVFISHAAPDKRKLRQIIDALIEAGIKVWIDNPAHADLSYSKDFVNEHFFRLGSGRSWHESLDAALHDAGAVLVCWSRNTDENRKVLLSEASYARVAQKLISCRIDDVDVAKLPAGFSQDQILDLSSALPPEELAPRLKLLTTDIRKMLAGSERQKVFREREQAKSSGRPKDLFISYRREDEPHAAGRLYLELSKAMAADRIFMDIDGIPLGRDFVDVIEERVAQCKVLLAVIGPRWISASRKVKRMGLTWSKPRLHDPEDFVRLEICSALKRKIPIVPVLVDNTKMPPDVALPSEMRKLTRYQAAQIAHHSFSDDAKVLASGLVLSGLTHALPGGTVVTENRSA